MTWFGKSKAAQTSGKPLPPNDPPDAGPRPLPKMSEARERAIAEAVSQGKARGVLHALFLWRAGELDLPA